MPQTTPAPLQKIDSNSICPLLCKSRYDCSSPSPPHSAASASRCTCLLSPVILLRSTAFTRMIVSRNLGGYRCSNTSGSGTVVSSPLLWTAPCKTMNRKMLCSPGTILYQGYPTRILPGSSALFVPPATQHAQLSKSSCTRLNPPVCMICAPALFLPGVLLGNITCSRFGCCRIIHRPGGP